MLWRSARTARSARSACRRPWPTATLLGVGRHHPSRAAADPPSACGVEAVASLRQLLPSLGFAPQLDEAGIKTATAESRRGGSHADFVGTL